MSDTPSVVALLAAHNEADVIGAVVKALIDDGVSVYLLDHGSTDGTADVVRPWLGHGVIDIETFPSGDRFPAARDSFSWSDILERKRELSTELNGDWFIHHDADEFRESIWEHLSLAEAIGRVDTLGYNAIDFEVLNFWPTDDGFSPGDDPRTVLRYYEPGGPWDKQQVKCWKRTSSPPDLVSSGGHDVTFPGRRVFPLRFLLRHYPVRSQTHGERKVLRERRPRFRPEELARDWHVQYDAFDDHRRFVRDPASLIAFDPTRARVDALVRHRGVDDLSDRIDRLTERLEQRDQAIDALRVELGSALARVDAAESELAASLEAQRAETGRLTNELDAHKVEADRLRQEVEALRTSASWRVTAPLRALYRVGRRR